MHIINEVIVVEGKYDKLKLSTLFDALILTTDGFRLRRNAERRQLLRRLAELRGIIIVTDSDSAGLKIRRYVRHCLDGVQCCIKDVYIPSIAGKERRKRKPSAEQLIGVEGMQDAQLAELILNAASRAAPNADPITKADLYAAGLSGGDCSAARRDALQQQLCLPRNMSANELLRAVNMLYTRQQFLSIFHSC